jgi:hypothetical protein
LLVTIDNNKSYKRGNERVELQWSIMKQAVIEAATEIIRE